MVGSHIVDACIAAGAEKVTALDALVRGVPENVNGALATGRARLVEIDVRDREAVAANVTGADIVFHQAALRWTRCQEEPRECQEVMVEGTFNVLEAAAAAKAKRVVLASSAVVYGDPQRLPVDEDHPLTGRTVYAAAKVANEQMARAFGHVAGLPTTTLRYFNIYGPRMDIRSPYVEVMIRWLDRIDAGQPLVVNGDGSASRDFVHIDDVVRANLLACEASSGDAILNVCSGRETTMRELAEMLLELTGSGVGVEYRPQAAGGGAQRLVGDPRRVEKTIGFRATTDLREGIRGLIAWRREAVAQTV